MAQEVLRWGFMRILDLRILSVGVYPFVLSFSFQLYTVDN